METEGCEKLQSRSKEEIHDRITILHVEKREIGERMNDKMNCMITTHFKVADSYVFDENEKDDYMALSYEINITEKTDLMSILDPQVRLVADLCGVPEENVAIISRERFETGSRGLDETQELEDKVWHTADEVPQDAEPVLVWFEYYRYGKYNRLCQKYGLSYAINGKWSGIVNDTSGWNKLRIIAWKRLPKNPFFEKTRKYSDPGRRR